MIVERKKGWHAISEKGKNLGGPYPSKARARKRLAQVEYFKRKKGRNAMSRLDPKRNAMRGL